jgi:excisionase family DNA binding protein
MENYVVIKMEVDEFSTLLRRVIREELKSILEELSKSSAVDNTLISRKEAAKLLKVSLPTMNNLQKTGRIPFLKVGRRVLYKRGELLKYFEVSNIKPRRYQL